MQARIDRAFWTGRRVYLTGHTGFKGAWLSLLLSRLGAEVWGYALPPQADGVFEAAGVERDLHHKVADIRDVERLTASLAAAKADVVIHMAAQALVRPSYEDPLDTYAVNVMGTVHLLEAVRRAGRISAVVVVTSDKCYENREWLWGYREDEALGGHDPYSNSKGCAELVTAAYRDSFFAQSACNVATGRAGNVIGGGDWSKDRLVPDAVRAFSKGEVLRIRNPNSIRPWQHVLEPVGAYLILAQSLAGPKGREMTGGWNFGPPADSEVSVGEIVERLATLWGSGASWQTEAGPHPHEAKFLKLDCSKARYGLGWTPVTDVDDAIRETIAWYRAQREGANMRDFTLTQIDTFLERRCA